MSPGPERSHGDEIHHTEGAGTDLVFAGHAADEQIRYWIEGEPFPRVVVDIPNSQILTGNGQGAPSALISGGAGGSSAGLSPFTPLGSVGAGGVTLAGDAGTGAWTDLGNVGTARTLTG